MIIVMRTGASPEQVEEIVERIKQEGLSVHLSEGVEKTIIGAIGDKSRLESLALEAYPAVDKVVPILRPYKLAGREFHPQDTVIDINGLKIGGNQVHVMAGPCAVESRDQILETARAVKQAGATILRGGAFKPRTSPYSFQGLEEEGLKLLAEAREQTGLLIVTEVVDPRNVELVANYADILQVGARNMQNFFLLRELSTCDKPVMLKRGPSATYEEWIMAAEYLMAGGNYNVMFCERGIRTFETHTRNTLDLCAVPVLKQLSHLPVIIDPSHGTGRRDTVKPMSMAAIAAGADGLMIEVHPEPSKAMSDGPQSLTPQQFAGLMGDLRKVAEVMGRTL